VKFNLRFFAACVAVTLGGCAKNPAPSVASSPAAGEKPKLVVMVLVDQLRADIIDRHADLFTGGFKRLLVDGHYYTNATHDHAITETAPGHADLSTGVYPSRHGIVSDEWFAKHDGKWVYTNNVFDPNVKIVGQPQLEGASPLNLERSGFAEWLKSADSRAIIASASGKDRGAILPAAHTKGYVYWFALSVGRFVTSTYYRDSDPAWMNSFNDKLRERFGSDTVWQSTVPASMASRSDNDTVATEGDGIHTAFPHTFREEGTPNRFWQWWSTIPDLDLATIDLAETMVTSLGMGRDDVTDFLNVSASSTDRVGHAYGPDSREQLDNLLRLDRELGQFFDFLDKTVGKGKWTMMLTADHGILDLPEDIQARGGSARRLNATDKATFDSLRAIANNASDPKAAAVRLRDDLKKLPVIANAWTQDQLKTGEPADSFEVLRRHAMWPGREAGVFSRDGVEIQFVPGVIFSETTNPAGSIAFRPRGTNHGSPYYYDRHVPMIFMGPGIAPGRDASRARTIDFAPTFAALLGITYPADLDGKPLSAIVSHR
jgi:predicted AlkP superfamily pyrophosphatase or phosphodiesterase